MALQDLTPQLRTRLRRMERVVGSFIMLALGLLVFGFVYYVYTTAQRKGWFKIKAPYFTFTDRATGLKVGDPVQLMGFPVGQITVITAQPANDFVYNVYIEFELKEPFYDYIWTKGSRAKVTTADLLGKRVLEVTRGTGGYPAYIFYPLRTNISLAEAQVLPEPTKWLLAQDVFDLTGTNLVAKAWTVLTNLSIIKAAGCTNISVMDAREKRSSITGVWDDQEQCYNAFFGKPRDYFWLLSDESAAVTERLEKVVAQIEEALPKILSLTNQLGAVLSNGVDLTSNLNIIALSARPAVSNLAAATAGLDRAGGLGEWLLPTNLSRRLETTLDQAHSTLRTADTTLNTANTNLTALALELDRSLENLANLTSNLNQQVQVNSNVLSEISTTVIHADEFVQGLKHHWLLRSAFKTKKTNAPPAATVAPKGQTKP
jgi:ABC-type transporter Mla subunit MlaD